MIDLYYAATPNGLKIKLFLEEADLAYRIIPLSLSQGEQFKPAFLALSPNNKIPAEDYLALASRLPQRAERPTPPL